MDTCNLSNTHEKKKVQNCLLTTKVIISKELLNLSRYYKDMGSWLVHQSDKTNKQNFCQMVCIFVCMFFHQANKIPKRFFSHLNNPYSQVVPSNFKKLYPTKMQQKQEKKEDIFHLILQCRYKTLIGNHNIASKKTLYLFFQKNWIDFLSGKTVFFTHRTSSYCGKVPIFYNVFVAKKSNNWK